MCKVLHGRRDSRPILNVSSHLRTPAPLTSGLLSRQIKALPLAQGEGKLLQSAQGRVSAAGT
jgi:hypothetical protein